jgi:RHS repeat-associated protein
VDLSVGGRGPGLVLERSYNSLNAVKAKTAGPFGFGWTDRYNARLTINKEAETATVEQGNGSGIVFYLNKATKTYSAGAWVQAALVESGSNYIYTLPDQSKLEFNSSGQLTKETDRYGNAVTLAYNGESHLETVTDGAGRKLTFTYIGGQISSVKDPMGNTVKYTYTAEQLASVTLPGETEPRWKFEYGAAHLLTKMTDGLGNAVEMEYDATRRVSAQTDALKRRTTWKYAQTKTGTETKMADPNGSEMVALFNSAGEPTSVTNAAGTASAVTNEFTYNSSFDLTVKTDADKHTTEYGYNATNDKTSEKDPNGNETKWEYNTTHDVIATTTPKLETTTIKRDSHGRPLVIEQPAPGKTTQATKYEYDGQEDPTSETDPLGRATKYTYDKYGDRESKTDPAGDKRTWEYNEDSEETAEVSPRGNAEGSKPLLYTTKTELDAQGRPIVVTDPLGHTTKTAYDADGNVKSITDGNGHTTKYTYDADNEPTKVEYPNGAITETGYDSEGQAKSQTDGNKHTTKYERNLLREVTEEIDPLERKTKREYDPAGNLKKVTDAMGRSITYTHDPGNRLTAISYSDGKTPEVKYEYDEDSNVKKMHDGTGETTNTYDQLDRLTETKDGHGDVVGYEYDLANEPTKIKYPKGEAVTRTYDKASRLEAVTDWLKNTTKFSYDPDSELTATVFPAGTENEDKYTYNEADQMKTVSMFKGKETLGSIVYARDSYAQLTKATTMVLPGEKEVEYKYDENSRLAKAGSTEYEYDPANNPKKIGSNTYTYNAADELEKGTTASYAYNEDGQRTKTTPTSGSATTYGYDQIGNLTSVERPLGKGESEIKDSYTYDGNSLRASQTIGAVTTHLTWVTTERLPVVIGDETNSYIYGPGGLPIEQINGENKVLYLHHDQQGSSRLLTNAKGATETTYVYEPYGTTAKITGTATTPLQYDGQYTSSDTGLIYLRARTYDPQTGFLSVDPAFPDTQARYTYSRDDPLNMSDPSGLNTNGGCGQISISIPLFVGGGLVCRISDGAMWATTLTISGTSGESPQLRNVLLEAVKGSPTVTSLLRAGANVSVRAAYQWSNARNVAEREGASTIWQITVGFGWFSGNYTEGRSNNGGISRTVGAGVTLPPGVRGSIGAGGGGGGAYTWVW